MKRYMTSDIINNTMPKRRTIPRAYEAIHSALQDEILNGQLQPGQPLPTEAELVKRFGVTRHTVREAMRVLEQTGLVQRGLGRRLYVTLPKYKQLAPRASRALLMQKVSFRELWEVAMHLEVCAAELLIDKVSASVIEELEENIEQTREAISKNRPIIELDVAFHSCIADSTGNCALQLAREPISLLFYPALSKLLYHPVTREMSPRRLLAAHREIVDALKRRDLDGVRLWMSRHMADFRRGYEAAGLDIDAPADSPANFAGKTP